MSPEKLSWPVAILAVSSPAVLVCLGIGPAQAEKFVARPVTHVSKESLKNSCAAAGGDYGELGEDYWCQKGSNTVACNMRKCTAVNGGVNSAGTVSQTRPPTSPDLHPLESPAENVK